MIYAYIHVIITSCGMREMFFDISRSAFSQSFLGRPLMSLSQRDV